MVACLKSHYKFLLLLSMLGLSVEIMLNTKSEAKFGIRPKLCIYGHKVAIYTGSYWKIIPIIILKYDLGIETKLTYVAIPVLQA